MNLRDMYDDDDDEDHLVSWVKQLPVFFAHPFTREDSASSIPRIIKIDPPQFTNRATMKNQYNDAPSNIHRHAMLVQNLSRKFGYGLDAYLNILPSVTDRATTGLGVSTENPHGMKLLSTIPSRLYVVNIDPSVNEQRLKDYFVEKGFGVKEVFYPQQEGRNRYGFVTFINNETAATVLALVEENEKFCLADKELTIEVPRKTVKSLVNHFLKTQPFMQQDSTTSHRITDVHYGNLISAKALQCFQRKQSIAYDPNEQGIIGHRLVPSSSPDHLYLKIDFHTRKISIVIDSGNRGPEDESVRSELSLTWHFQDLEQDKIKPVLIEETFKDRQQPRYIYLLFQVKRSPMIYQRVVTDFFSENNDSKARLPGNHLIGHANVWLFRLSPDITNAQSSSLFNKLHRAHLIPKNYRPEQMQQIINATATAQLDIDAAKLISNNLWIEQNRAKIDEFLNWHWPLYPFETKFEIMKLISKHFITPHDLVFDDALGSILSQCSMGTFLACTDIIAHMAPRWLGEAVDQEYDDQNEDPECDANNILLNVRNHNIRNRETSVDITLRSSMGDELHVRQISHEVNASNTPSSLNIGTGNRLGVFSQLLLHALTVLRRRRELRRDLINNFCLIRNELRSNNQRTLLTRKVYITPSTIVYEGPYYEEKCAVTRMYKDNHDQFLRVIFRDEHFQRLSNNQNDMQLIYPHIKDVLLNGITICDRQYDFLAFSSSQLREHSCWMFASLDGVINADLIRVSMGNFTGVHPVAKYAARLGQSFSTTIEGVALNSNDFTEIPDIKSSNGKLCFTDGIGIISPSFAAELNKTLKTSNSDVVPSAFQIRAGGYKGVLCIDVSNQTRDRRVKVIFRDSMNKFIGDPRSIDVIHTSEYPSPAYLNRQIILLLSSMDLENAEKTFHDLQAEEIKRTRGLTGRSQEACKILKDLGENFGYGCHQFLIDYLKTFKQVKEPFTHRMLLAMQAFRMKELKTRAKIRVPDSWCLLGVVDETGTLEYGQVFIQIDDPDDKKTPSRIIKGAVIVTRNPCFHPGDIRSLEAVDVPALRLLKNVIVFPSRGERPHPGEMSGGDLDGDTFWISQYPRLIFPFNKEPLDSDPRPTTQTSAAEKRSTEITPYTPKDVIDFFVEYLEVDNLGAIANSHLALADQLPLGAEDPKCLQLAKMYSLAVDFAKTGVSASRLTKELRPEQYPHYMEKEDKVSYESQTIVGQLYDQVKNEITDLEIDVQLEIRMAATFPYQAFRVDGYEQYQADAISTKHEYDRELKRLMGQYGIKNEQEVISGYILRFNSKQYSNESRAYDLKNDIAQSYCKIRQRYLQVFWKEFYQMDDDSSNDDDDTDQQLSWSSIAQSLKWTEQYEQLEFHRRRDRFEQDVKRKASAWFIVTYQPWIDYFRANNQTCNSHQTIPKYVGLLSFAWLVYPVLLEIYKENSSA